MLSNWCEKGLWYWSEKKKKEEREKQLNLMQSEGVSNKTRGGNSGSKYKYIN